MYFFLLSSAVAWFPPQCPLFVSLLVGLHDYHKRFSGQMSLSTSKFVLNKKCWDGCQQVRSDQLFYKKLTSPPPTQTACFHVDRLSRNSLPLIWNNSIKTKIENCLQVFCVPLQLYVLCFHVILLLFCLFL